MDQRITRLDSRRDEAVVVGESLESLVSLWACPANSLRWDCPFVLPAWLTVWWQAFGQGMESLLFSVRQGDDILGIVPLTRRGDGVAFMGSANVCDYLDFVVSPGREEQFFRTVIGHLKDLRISGLTLETVRPDSTVLEDLVPLAESTGCRVLCEQVDVSLELDLPDSWEEFLGGLSGKERHEVRRKMRRLEDSARVRFGAAESPREVALRIETFLELMKRSRPEKAAFLTEPLTVFFRALSGALAEAKLLNLFFLDLDEQPAAAALCFTLHDTVYLYNSGFDPQWRQLSAGLLNKVFSIRESIQRGRKKYDFLKGAEVYKHRLGGREIPLYRCQIALA